MIFTEDNIQLTEKGKVSFNLASFYFGIYTLESIVQNRLTQVMQKRCYLRTGGIPRRLQAAVVPLHDSLAAEPLHGRERVSGDGQRIVVAEDIGIFAHADVQSPVLRILIQDRGQLLSISLYHFSYSL